MDFYFFSHSTLAIFARILRKAKVEDLEDKQKRHWISRKAKVENLERVIRNGTGLGGGGVFHYRKKGVDEPKCIWLSDVYKRQDFIKKGMPFKILKWDLQRALFMKRERKGKARGMCVCECMCVRGGIKNEGRGFRRFSPYRRSHRRLGDQKLHQTTCQRFGLRIGLYDA